MRIDHYVDIVERNFVRGVYHSELKQFEKSIYSDFRESNPELYKIKEIELLEEKIKNKGEHLRKVIQHIANGRKKQIVIFIDNADQRDEETQQQAFLISQEIAERWKPVTVFVALRPETFYRSQKIGALSGYHPKAFTISPPRIDRVIEKRLEFALKLTNGQIPVESLTGGVHINLQKLGYLIKVFLASTKQNKELGECIDNIAGGNVRLALDLVRGFFGSGHVDTQKIINIYEESKSYKIPLHEFIRAVIYGDSEYFNPEQSPITNLFEIFNADPKEHFLLPLLLGLLGASGGSDADEGFIETSVIYEKLQGLGYTPEQVDSGVIVGHKKKLLEAAARRIPQPGLDMPQALRLTTLGAYHIRRLCKMFTYIDAVVIDTNVLDDSFRASIHNEANVLGRLSRANIFRQYLDKQWEYLIDTGAVNAFDWVVISKILEADIKNIQGRL